MRRQGAPDSEFGSDHRASDAADAARLEELVDSDEHVDAREYVALLRRVGRFDPQRVIDLGARTYSFGLKQVFSDADTAGLLEVAFAGSVILDASGRHEQAIARLEQAAALVSFDQAAVGSLAASQVFLQAAAGRVDVALGLDGRLAGVDFETDLHAAADLAGARCIMLDFSKVEEAQALIKSSRSDGLDYVASFLMVQAITSLMALGQSSEAEAAGRDLHAYAAEVGHPARQVDAQAALLMLSLRRTRNSAPDGLLAEAERLKNNHPLWKMLVALYRQAAHRREAAETDFTHGQLTEHYDWLNHGYRNSFEGLAAYRYALSEAADVLLATPGAPTIFSLPNILASAEAVAMGGTLSAAADWLVWLEEELPAEVVTSLEWPACRQRLEALLWLRMGEREDARAGLERSIRVCEERGDTIEAEIGRAQLAALVSDDEQAALAASRLEDVGITSGLFADAALRIDERAKQAGARLTLLEAQVVGRIANGLSHKEIEADLGLPPRGASRAITSGYAKLGVKGRVRGAQVARERLIA